MKICNVSRKGKEKTKRVPNTIAFSMIKTFFTSKEYKEIREDFSIDNLSKKQIEIFMDDVRELFRSYKDLEVMTIEREDGEIEKYIL
ncbi:MAG: hypothetical protein LBR30_02425 [Clostridioides sp.]|jgi:hypothetical protein|nr:hypothetical protein [Clostridioides sp.]